MDVKTMMVLLHKASVVLTDELACQKSLITIMDTLGGHGIDDNEGLEGLFAEVREYRKLRHPSKPLGMISSMDEGLLRAITKWCRVKGIVTAEDFTSKVSAVKSWPN